MIGSSMSESPPIYKSLKLSEDKLHRLPQGSAVTRRLQGVRYYSCFSPSDPILVRPHVQQCCRSAVTAILNVAWSRHSD